MPGDNQPPSSRSDELGRRTFVKAGGTVAAGLAVTGGTVGTVAAQDDGFFDEDEAMQGLMFREQFEEGGLFTIASPVIDYVPDVEEVRDEAFQQYNTRTIRYIEPTTRNVPLFPQNEAPIGPYEEEFGFVVDDDFVEDDDFGDFEDDDEEDEIVLDDEPVEAGGIENEELQQLRPTIFALEQNFTPFQPSERMVYVRFSPVPEDEEEGLYEEYETEIFGEENPF